MAVHFNGGNCQPPNSEDPRIKQNFEEGSTVHAMIGVPCGHDALTTIYIIFTLNALSTEYFEGAI